MDKCLIYKNTGITIFTTWLLLLIILVPSEICDGLTNRVNEIISQGLIDHVSHSGLGTDAVSDAGGVYNHHIFKGPDIRKDLPELKSIYHAIVPLVSLVTCTDTIVSPYPLSDINIKAYPPGGGTLGLHYDTNGITVLLFLTDNKEAPLRMQIERSHPGKKENWIEQKIYLLKKAHYLLCKGEKHSMIVSKQ